MRRHRFDITSMIFGIVFVGVGLAFLQGDVDLWQVNWNWFWPIALTFAGIVVLNSLRPSPQAEETVPAEPDQEPF